MVGDLSLGILKVFRDIRSYRNGSIRMNYNIINIQLFIQNSGVRS